MPSRWLFVGAVAAGSCAQAQDDYAIASSEETRAIVESMMADAALRTSLQSAAKKDGPPPLRIWGFTQFRYTFNHREETEPPGEDKDTYGFSLNRVRLFFDSNPFEGISARVRTTFSRSTGDATLDQAYATLTLPDSYKLRLGQFSLPLFRDENISADRQLAVNASTVDELYNQGNIQGIMLMREWEEIRFWAAYSDGIRSANKPWGSEFDADLAVSTRWEWMVQGDSWARFDDYTSFPGSDTASVFGAAVHYETGSRDTELREDLDLFYLTLDFGIEGNGWNLFFAGVGVYTDDAEGDDYIDSGYIAQGGFFISEHTELFGRFDIIMAGDDRPDDLGNFRTLTAGANYYFFPGSHALKFTANLIWFLDPQATSLAPTSTNTGLLPSPADGQWAIQAQMQVIF